MAKKLKSAKCGGTKMPKYSNDPRTEQGRILKKGGAVHKMPNGKMMKGKTHRKR